MYHSIEKVGLALSTIALTCASYGVTVVNAEEKKSNITSEAEHHITRVESDYFKVTDTILMGSNIGVWVLSEGIYPEPKTDLARMLLENRRRMLSIGNKLLNSDEIDSLVDEVRGDRGIA